MPAASLIDGIAVRVGYCSQTTAKLTVVALQDTGTLSVSVAGGSAVITTPLTGLGADHPTRVGEYPMYYAHIDITGLQPGQRTAYTVSKNGHAVTGSVLTLPADGQDFAFMVGTCERPEQHSPIHGHIMMREFAESQSIPVYWYVHIDDNWYPDEARFWGFQPGFGSDAATGLAVSDLTKAACDTGLSWDYCLNWLCYFGLLESHPHGRHPDRLWWHRNMPLWSQWGDHEVAPNWQRGEAGQGKWYGPKETPAFDTAADFAEVGTENFFADVAVANWRALFGQSRPPLLGASGEHWGTTVGPLTMTAPDMNTFADGRHNLVIGNGVGCGRKADGSVDLGETGDPAKPCMGATQVTEVLSTYATAQTPFNVMFTANGISGHNEPWAQWWIDEFDDLLKREAVGLLNNAYTNGTDGKFGILKGDSHTMHVVSYHADGSAAGLGGSTFNGPELWEICPATINGSATAKTTFQFGLFNRKLRMLKDGEVSRGRHLHGFLHVVVRASESPQRMDVSLIDTSSGDANAMWSGAWTDDVPGNNFQRTSQPKIG